MFFSLCLQCRPHTFGYIRIFGSNSFSFSAPVVSHVNGVEFWLEWSFCAVYAGQLFGFKPYFFGTVVHVAQRVNGWYKM